VRRAAVTLAETPKRRSRWCGIVVDLSSALNSISMPASRKAEARQVSAVAAHRKAARALRQGLPRLKCRGRRRCAAFCSSDMHSARCAI